MLQVSVVDSNAEERLRTLQWLQQVFEVQGEGLEFAPRVNFRPVSISELKFQSTPDIIIVGPTLAAGPSDDLNHIKKAVPNIPIMVIAASAHIPLATVEYLSRIGIEEILSRDIKPQELIRRFVMLAARVRRLASGSLIVVESAKGGVGATSIAAGLGEMFAEQGKKTVLVDLDSERQALSRFLQARPFLNESLQGILDGHRPISSDFVEHCVVQVWKDLPGLYCLPPCAEGILEGTLSAQVARILINLFEVLDTLYDVVIADASDVRGTTRRILHRAADTVLFVTESDPASVYASFEKLKRIREEISPQARLRVLENRGRSKSAGLNRIDLEREFERSAGIASEEWIRSSIPYCSQASRWPASGLTSYSAAGNRFQRALRNAYSELIGSAETVTLLRSSFEKVVSVWRICQQFFKRFLSAKREGASPQLESKQKTELGAKISEKLLGQVDSVPQIGWKINSVANSSTVDNFVTPPQ